MAPALNGVPQQQLLLLLLGLAALGGAVQFADPSGITLAPDETRPTATVLQAPAALPSLVALATATAAFVSGSHHFDDVLPTPVAHPLLQRRLVLLDFPCTDVAIFNRYWMCGRCVGGGTCPNIGDRVAVTSVRSAQKIIPTTLTVVSCGSFEFRTWAASCTDSATTSWSIQPCQTINANPSVEVVTFKTVVEVQKCFQGFCGWDKVTTPTSTPSTHSDTWIMTTGPLPSKTSTTVSSAYNFYARPVLDTNSWTDDVANFKRVVYGCGDFAAQSTCVSLDGDNVDKNTEKYCSCKGYDSWSAGNALLEQGAWRCASYQAPRIAVDKACTGSWKKQVIEESSEKAVFTLASCEVQVAVLNLVPYDALNNPIVPTDTANIPWIANNVYYLAISTLSELDSSVKGKLFTTNQFKCDPTSTVADLLSSCVLSNYDFDLWGGGYGITRPSPLRYLNTSVDSIQIKVLPRDPIATAASAKVECNPGNGTSSDAQKSWSWDASSGVLKVTMPATNDSLCIVSVSLTNKNGGSTTSTLPIAVVTSPPSKNANYRINITSSLQLDGLGSRFQKDAKAVAVSWTNRFIQKPQDFCKALGVFASVCQRGIISYSYNMILKVSVSADYSVPPLDAAYSSCQSVLGCQPCPPIQLLGTNETYLDQRACLANALLALDQSASQLQCIGCVTILLQPAVTACNEVNFCVTDSDPGTIFRFSQSPPLVSELAFSPSKAPYFEKLWYSGVTSALFNATVFTPAVPWTGNANVNLRISVGGYMGTSLQALYDGSALETNVFPSGNPPSPFLVATSLRFLGELFHGEQYLFSLEVTNGFGLRATSAASVWVDTSPPDIPYARFTELVNNPGTQRAVVALSGLFDLESGIKEVWTKVGKNATDVCACDFGTAASWQNFTGLDLSTNANNPSLEQQIPVDLSIARAENWTEVRFAVAVINHAWTTSHDTASVSYVCLDPLSLEPSTGAISITQISVEGESASQNLTGDRSVQVSWLTSDVVAGVAFVTANLSVPGMPTTVAGPFYSKNASLDIVTNFRIPANVSIEVCLNATSNSMPPAIISACRTTTLPPQNIFDAQCVQVGLIYNDLQDGQVAATGTVYADWTKCTLLNAEKVNYWLVSSTSFTLITHGSAKITDGSVPIAFDETWPADSVKFCFMAMTASGYVDKNFCTHAQTIDTSPPRPLGGVYDMYAGSSVDSTVVVRASTNTASYLVRWDDWEDSETSITSFNLTLVDAMQGLLVKNVTLSGDMRVFLFQNLSLEAGRQYYATVRAMNGGNLQSLPIRSAGVTISAVAPSAAPQVSVTNGLNIKKDGRTVKLFVPRNESTIHVTWSGFTGDAVQQPTYSVELTPYPGSAAAPFINLTSQNDIFLNVPSRDDTYTLTVSLKNTDGTSQTASFSSDIWVTTRAQVSAPSALFCDVDFTTFDRVKKTVMLSTTLSPPVDPFHLIVGQGLRFRRAGKDSQSSGSLVLGAADTAKSGAVSYIYGSPSALDEFNVECVWEATDVTGIVTSAVFAGRRTGVSGASEPAVLALSTWTQSSLPSSAIDFAYFKDISVTANTTFMVGLQSFPAIFENGAQVASLSYMVYYMGFTSTAALTSDAQVADTTASGNTTVASSGNTTALESINPTVLESSNTTTLQNTNTTAPANATVTTEVSVSQVLTPVDILPWTTVDITGTQPLAQYKIRLASTLVPMFIFEPTHFSVRGGFPAELSTVYICAAVTTFATAQNVSACSAGVLLDSQPPTAGVVSFKNTISTAGNVAYLTTADSVSVSWSGFLKSNWQFTNDSGIDEFRWAVGSFAGADDYVPFTSLPGSASTASANINLPQGSILYASVYALDYAGRAVRAVSSQHIIVDSSPPVSDTQQLEVLARANSDGSTFVRVGFAPWHDKESGILSVVWTVESMYGASDILPMSPVTFSNLAYANLPLLPGVTYVARVVATNQASLTTELVSTFETKRPVQKVYLVDGSDVMRTKVYDTNPTSYTAKWRFTGGILDFVVGVGSAPRQDDIWSFKGLNASVGSLTVPLSVSDGTQVFTTIFVQDSSGIFQTFVSPGMICDTSAPIRGWVTVEGRNVHQMTVPRQNVISASWIGFSDPESDIARYEYCIDLDDNVTNPACKITGWINNWTELQLVDAPIAGGAILPVGTRCYVKVRAFNTAGLSTNAASPPFVVDPVSPQGGRVSVSFPGLDGHRSMAPVAADNITQLYLDRSCVNVSWAGFSGNITDYRVALFQAPGTLISQYVSTGIATSRAFTGLNLAAHGPGAYYFAAVQAWTDAGLYSESISRFRVVSDGPGTGSVTVLAVSTSSIRFYVVGFLDGNDLRTSFEISVGLAAFGAEVGQIVRPNCPVAPCTFQIDVPIAAATVYFLTVRAVNEAGLYSPASTARAMLSVPLSTAISARNQAFTWNVTTDVPFVNSYMATANLTGTRLTEFISNVPVAVRCVWTPGNTFQGSLDAGNNQDRPVISCPSPWNAIAEGQSLQLQAEINGTKSNPVTFWYRERRKDWNTTAPEVGLYFQKGSAFRVSTATAIVKWATNTTSISHFRIMRGADLLPQIWPSSARNATVFSATPMNSPLIFSVCAYFVGTGPTPSSCIAAPPVSLDLTPPLINTNISSKHAGPLSTTVRVTAPDLLPLGTSQYVGLTNVNVSWDETFQGSGGKSIVRYLAFLGTAPRSALNGATLSSNATDVLFTVDLVAGVPYFATVVAIDEAGLLTTEVSSAFISDISAPDVGTVHIGKRHLSGDVKWQAQATSLSFYLRSWSDHISGIYEFWYRQCTVNSCSSKSSIGLSVDNKVPATLMPGTSYWVSIQATNGAGRESDWVNSTAVTIDAKKPVVTSIDFTGRNGEFATSIAELGLTWEANSGSFAPIREYAIQVGTVAGGGQLMPPTNVGSQASFSLRALALTHNTVIYATVRAISENGLEDVAVSAGLRIDLTAPLILGSVRAQSGNNFAQSTGSLNVTADWEGVFTDPESSIVRYQWAVGTAGEPSLFSKTFLDAGVSLSASFVCLPTENSHFVVTVIATNAAGLSSSATSNLVMRTSTPPPNFVIAPINEGIQSLNGTLFIPSSIGRFSLGGLQDPVSGLKEVQMQLINAVTNLTIQDWFSVGALLSISLAADSTWLFTTLQLNARVSNNAGLTTRGSSPKFVLNSTDIV
ncbi:hypothetical protein HDU86_005566 [Geranomyces michiganensis]|nr:hypothetical protein HDU86_005566 [Geranomyces michiganensis]